MGKSKKPAPEYHTFEDYAGYDDLDALDDENVAEEAGEIREFLDEAQGALSRLVQKTNRREKYTQKRPHRLESWR